MGFTANDIRHKATQRFKGVAGENEFKLRYMIRKYERMEGVKHYFSCDIDALCLYFANEFLKWKEKPRSQGQGDPLDKFEEAFSSGFEMDMLDASDVSWLEGKEDECLVAWVVCRKHHKGKRYHDFGLPLNPSTHKDIYAAVKDFFVSLEQGPRGRKEFADKIREVLAQLDKAGGMFSWVKDDDDDFMSWLFDYLDGKSLMEGLSSLPISCDRAKVFKAAYFLWRAHPDTKTIFLRNARTAWSQRKFRVSNKDNGRLNTYIGKKAKQALVNLADDDGVKIKDVLQKLIMNEYDRRKK